MAHPVGDSGAGDREQPMDVFLQIVLSFPTVVFSVLLTIAVVYWLMAALGILELDVLDGWLTPDIEGVELDGFAGTLMKFGLGGLPLMLILTVLVFVAWLLSYYVDYLLLRHVSPGAIRWLLGAAAMVGALVVAVPVTSVVLRPVRMLFDKLRPAPTRSLLGMVAVVRSPQVNATHGFANVEDGGAGLVLQVRTDIAAGFARGDRVVLIEYLDADNAYRVIGEKEFQGL
jgi:hypothetical protein